MTELITTINGWAWGPLMLVLLLGTGIYLSLGLRFVTIRKIPMAFGLMLSGRKGEGAGDISPFSALVGMATKYAEAVCAVKYREQDEDGNYSGGPMYYIRNGLHKRWHWLGVAFAIFGSLAGFGIANTVQSNSVSQVLNDSFSVPPLITGLVLMVLVGAVVLGGIKRIASVASLLVPLMAISYILMCLYVIATNLAAVPGAISYIVDSAMTGLVIVIMDVLPSGVSGASLTTMAFSNALPGGSVIVTVALCLFAFTTMIGWSFYGERCVVFLFGTRAIMPFRVAWVVAIPIGTIVELDLIWLIADTLNAFMAIPNLIALLLLGPMVFKLSKEYFNR